MRERARWCTADGDLTEWYDADEMAGILRGTEPEHSRIRHDAEHIASWHPAVALAVADWLDSLVDAMTNPDAPNSGVSTDREERHALAVARAYLGDDT
jgi:hypothetical protein